MNADDAPPSEPGTRQARGGFLSRWSAVLLIAFFAVPAFAKPTDNSFDTTCDTLWQAVVDVLQNSGKYEIKTIDAVGRNASYRVGTSFSHMVDTVVLVPSGASCKLVIDAPYRGMAYNDAKDLNERVTESLAKIAAGGPTAPAAATTAAPTPAASQTATPGAVEAQATQSTKKHSKSLASSMGSSSQGSLFGSAGNTATPPPQPAAGPSGPVGQSAAGVPAGSVAITVNQRCEKDPDPLGLVTTRFYSSCKQDELNQVRTAVAAGLQARHIVVAGAGQSADVQLAITLTRSRWDGGMTDFSAGTTRFAADYQLTGGGSSAPGHVDYEEKGTNKLAENRFADKIAADVVGKLDAMPTAGSAASPSQGVTVITANGSTPTPEQLATALSALKSSEAALQSAGSAQSGAASSGPAVTASPEEVADDDIFYQLVGDAYRSLAAKPALPDDARAHRHEAEDAEEKRDAPTAIKAYSAALQSAPWWADGMRGLSLALAKTGDYQSATIWAHRYLLVAPDAANAALMKQEIDDWSKWTTPLKPASFTAPPGARLGVMIHDLPGVIAQAMGDPDLEGALVVVVLDGSAAQKAGLARGDVVTAADGSPIRAAKDLSTVTGHAQPGSTLHLKVRRGTETKDIDVALGQ